MNQLNETKVFFGATQEAAKQDARKWLAEQTDILQTLDSTSRQTDAGGWMVTIFFQRKAKSS